MKLHAEYARRCSPMVAGAGRLMSDDAGSAMVEFAFALTVLLTAIFAIIGGSLALYANHYVASAASEGARYAMVRGSGWGGAGCASTTSYGCTASSNSVKAYLLSVAPIGMSAAQTTIVTTWPGTNAAGSACYTANGANGAGCSVNVAVTYSFNMSLPLLSKRALLLSSSSTMPITQ